MYIRLYHFRKTMAKKKRFTCVVRRREFGEVKIERYSDESIISGEWDPQKEIFP